MKKQIAIAIFVLAGFLGFLYLEKPFREYLVSREMLELKARLTSGACVRALLIVLISVVIRKLNLVSFIRMYKPVNLQALIIPVVIIGLGLFGNVDTYLSVNAATLFLFGVWVLLVGVVEELVFRGFLFPQFLKAFGNRQSVLMWSAVLSSLLFGLVHFLNVLSQPENISGVTSQVFFALSVGVFFCGLLTRTESILIPVFIHALINFSFGAGMLNPEPEIIEAVRAEDGVNWSSVIPTTLFFAFILGGGIFMLLKSDKDKILKRLDN
ncbi:MAG: CPBP family intramembrane metalloprotease [Bacteroidetes bacterium]|nr:CPBP family intramembrane metalloprotease [Bacteroidota bacterium]